ncbi:Membrane-bound acyltransferase YfiQ, involved in biofilm formation [Catalinimonas alkaloidigena]|uniref:Membrane-bound acyltransferase YfiQ, involved in biofilm formation n=1 Tax=Catalinimonas alkaloidigena TaxID=1075417 RepID=A0A1G9J6L3_9BACT|nr:acyltransferase [Catalinimonas alkaloidigena]SDL32991.1 Membrane-bound acyltransferase YfiQ, involved in biofilm formation [Catalinimonas alkaloidigena]
MHPNAETSTTLEVPQAPKSSKRKFLRHVHYFRGFAILNIAFIHIWFFPEKYKDTPDVVFLSHFREVIFHASTIYFLFISGFLFAYLSSNFDTWKYYKSKFLNVLLPYILITTGLFLASNLSLIKQAALGELGQGWAEAILTGSIQVQYWYIPFIALVFLISPLLLKIPDRIFNALTLICSFLPLFGTRTAVEVSFELYMYFMPVYLWGMYAARNYDAFVRVIQQYKYGIALVAVVLSGVLFWLRLYPSQPDGVLEALYYVQKMAFTFLIFVFLMRYEHVEVKLLDQFAVYSFSIFFLHTIVDVYFIKKQIYEVIMTLPLYLIAPISLLYTALICLITLWVSMLIKKVLGKYSRYLIGS